MKFAANKTKATAIAVFLILTITATLVALPIANAHTPALTIPTWCYVAVTNSIIGVNQQEEFVFWLNAIPPTASGGYGDRWTFYVDITRPDGTNETLGPFTSDPVGGTFTLYTPTQVGTYTVMARMVEHKVTGLPIAPGQTISTISGAAYVNDTYAASASDPVEIIVQQEPIEPWHEAPLPTEYWTRPINSASRNWDVLAGNWLGTSSAATNVGPTTFFAYGKGPESSHVMWATPLWAGGTMDEMFGAISYTPSHYEGLTFVPPIILNGKIYYNVRSLPREGWYCIDLYTGEVEYFHNTTGPITGISSSSSGSIPGESLAFGQILEVENPNQKGGFPYLWSTSSPAGANTWMMFDAFSGNYICSIANVSSGGTAVYGKDGSILRYSLATSGGVQYLRCWNTSQAIWWRGTQQQYQAGDYSGFSGNSYWMWRPGLNVTYDGNHGFSLNVSISPAVQGSIYAVREGQYVIGGTAGKNNGTYILQGNLWALSLKEGEEGRLLWNITFTPPQTLPDLAAGSFGAGTAQLGTVDPEDGVFLFWESMTRRRWAYSLETGKLLWGPTAPEPQLNYYSIYTQTDIYKGMLLTCGVGGVLIAYDIKTGEVLWNYTAQQVGFESPYGNSPLVISCIVDGKIYLGQTFWGTNPEWRDYIRCVNASNGAELWKILCCDRTSGVAGQLYAADGYIVGLNYFDNQIYCFGKGPSATTVSAPQTVQSLGSSVMITGAVTDQCVGAKKIAEKVGFTNGVPAVSDASQEAWMEWLYEQQGKPDNATGVDVSLDTVDPNGNYVHIGTVTSDSSGMFKKMFTPDVPGEYTIIATFAGSTAYYGSYAETAIGVSEAPPATAPPEYPQPIDPTMTIIVVGIAIIIAVAIATILILRKRP
jgi:hypothetical protein